MTSDADLEELGALLRARGLRVTLPRVLVVAALRREGGTSAHGPLAERVASVHRTTVFRVLMDLVRAGLARRHDPGDRTWRYVLTEGSVLGAVAAFTCVACGERAEFPRDAIHVDRRRGVPRAARRADVDVELRGRCGKCTE